MVKAVFKKNIMKFSAPELLNWKKQLIIRLNGLGKSENIKFDEYEILISEINEELILRKEKGEKLGLKEVGNLLPEEGVMSAHGYHVGTTEGLKPEVRRRILEEIFRGPLIEVASLQYMEKWGEDNTKKRLNKICTNLREFIFRKKNMPNMKIAVKEWEEDLNWVLKNLSEKIN